MRFISYQLGWFSTARGSGSRALLRTARENIQRGEIDAEIAFVFCSREPGESEETDLFLKQVRSYRIPLVCFSYQKFKAKYGSQVKVGTLPLWRLDYDREVMKQLDGFYPDMCVLAGYMLVVGSEMCRKFNMINLHPAAPIGPKGTWQEVIWQLIDGKARETGVMVHLVTPELDRGPVVAGCTFAIRGEPFDKLWGRLENLPESSSEQLGARTSLFNLIRKHGLVRETPLIITTIKYFSEGKIKVTTEKQIVDVQGNLITGYDLTEEIDKQIERLD
ncbi:MAG: formyltransferase family protein [Dehalococcoidales bacterium]|nr:formyltransferase family protein [Dehalococcoidales bacterium]MDP6738003.1 formyltransferase family protein [Dehalococcoidales bacterium]